MTGKTTATLYAVINFNKEVLFTLGGSSTKERLMVYESYDKAKRGSRRRFGMNWPNKCEIIQVL